MKNILKKFEKTNDFKIECLGEQDVWVYDIEVDDTHTFFANDILVHNSNYLCLDKLVKKYFPDESDKDKIVTWLDKICKQGLQPALEAAFKEMGELVNDFNNSVIVMKREVISDAAVFVAKKRYVMSVLDEEGVRLATPKLKVTGIEAVRSSTPEVVKKYIKEAMMLSFTSSESALHNYIEEKRLEFRTLPFGDVAFPRGVNGVNEYADRNTIYKKGTPMHVKAALTYNHQINIMGLSSKYQLIKEGDKIKFCELKMPNRMQSSVIGCPIDILPEEFNLDDFIDRDLQFEKAFLNPLQNIIGCFGWNVEQKSSIEDFF